MAGIKITRFGLEGYGVRRAGSFSGKTPAPVAAPCIEPVISLMRDTPVAIIGTMAATPVAIIGAMVDKLPIVSIMGTTPVAVSGAMVDTVAVVGALC